MPNFFKNMIKNKLKILKMAIFSCFPPKKSKNACDANSGPKITSRRPKNTYFRILISFLTSAVA